MKCFVFNKSLHICIRIYLFLLMNHQCMIMNHLKLIYILDFCLTVHHQLGKAIQMNQLDATMIY